MHEYPAAQRIVEIAAEAAGARRVRRVTLVMGDACGYLPESIALFFELLGEGTACEAAALNIERTVSKLRCTACGALFVRAPFSFDCPDCGGAGAPTELGREFAVESIEIEE